MQGVGLTGLAIFGALTLLSNRAEAQRLWGYIGMNGTLDVPIEFDDAREFSNGFPAIAIGDCGGFIDTAGRVAIAGTTMGLTTTRISGPTSTPINSFGVIDRSDWSSSNRRRSSEPASRSPGRSPGASVTDSRSSPYCTNVAGALPVAAAEKTDLCARG